MGVPAPPADEYALPTQLWMVRDTVRAEAYRAALQAVVQPDHVVVDVGAGTGLLSLFAAQAGARKVYALERQRVAQTARRLAAQSPWSKRITVLQVDATDFELRERADILVSEWMGFYAIEENLLPVVVTARDQLLKPGGLMLPERFNTWAAPVEDPSHLLDWAFWNGRPYGLDLYLLAETVEQRPQYGRDHVVPGHLLADPQTLWSGDLTRLQRADVDGPWRAGVEFTATRDGQCTGAAVWFDVGFPGGTQLSTAPGEPMTHWGVTLLPTREPHAVTAGTPIRVRIVSVPTWPGHSTTYWALQIGDGAWDEYGGREDGELLLGDDCDGGSPPAEPVP